jgi:hypothetical protein
MNDLREKIHRMILDGKKNKEIFIAIKDKYSTKEHLWLTMEIIDARAEWTDPTS